MALTDYGQGLIDEWAASHVGFLGEVYHVKDWPYQVCYSTGTFTPYVAPWPWGGDRSPQLVLPRCQMVST